jgi:hypothetical protein
LITPQPMLHKKLRQVCLRVSVQGQDIGVQGQDIGLGQDIGFMVRVRLR